MRDARNALTACGAFINRANLLRKSMFAPTLVLLRAR
jgi:hypothetical protein